MSGHKPWAGAAKRLREASSNDLRPACDRSAATGRVTCGLMGPSSRMIPRSALGAHQAAMRPLADEMMSALPEGSARTFCRQPVSRTEAVQGFGPAVKMT